MLLFPMVSANWPSATVMPAALHRQVAKI